MRASCRALKDLSDEYIMHRCTVAMAGALVTDSYAQDVLTGTVVMTADCLAETVMSNIVEAVSAYAGERLCPAVTVDGKIRFVHPDEAPQPRPLN